MFSISGDTATGGPVLVSSSYSSDGKSPTFQSGDARSVQRKCLVTRIGISSQYGK